jgi:beta-lactamase regulating signal transducer with metallopeptidase domain
MHAVMIAWVVTYLLHSTIVVLGAWLLERRWGDRPERMSAVWKTALVGGLLTATVQTGLGVAPVAGRWELGPASASSPSPASPVASTGAVAAVASTGAFEASEVVVAAPGQAEARVAPSMPSWPPPEATLAAPGLVEGTAPPPAMGPAVERPPALARAAAHAPGSPGSSVTLGWAAVAPWGLAIVGLGALLGLASVAVAFVALRRQLAGRRALAEGTLPTLLEGLRRRAGIERAVRLTVAPRVQVPMAVGVLRPEIVVPRAAAEGLSPAHQESLLAHELAHVLRRDPAWRLFGLLVERVFFFQPLNRLASRRVAQAAEYLCDDWAARHTRQPLALARCLTEIATGVARPGPVPATMAGPRSILGRRVQRLLQPAPVSARPWWLSAALGLPLVGVVAVAPGVGAHAKAKGDRAAKAPARVVVIDAEGHGHAVRPREHAAIVVHGRNGEVVVRTLPDAAPAPAVADDGASRRAARKAVREQDRVRDRARREARKDLRRAFRAAKARGDAAPSRAEVEAVLRRARAAEGSRPEHVELHVVVPGELELHGRVPVDVEALEPGVEGLLDGLRVLEALGALEALEAELAAEGIDVVIHRRPGAAHPAVRIERSPAPRAPHARVPPRPAPAAVPTPPGLRVVPPAAPPAPPRGPRLRGPAPHAPRAPRPPAPPMAPIAPAAPQPEVGPVVWVSWTSPTHG